MNCLPKPGKVKPTGSVSQWGTDRLISSGTSDSGYLQMVAPLIRWLLTRKYLFQPA